MCHIAEINFKFLDRDLGDISCWSKFLTKNIQFLKWNSTKISNAEISYIRNIGNPVSFISNIRSKILMGTKDIWICVNLAYVPHVCTYYFSFFRAIGTYPYVFGAHKNFLSDVWYKRYRISNVSTPRNFCVRNFGRFSLEKLDIFGQKFRPT